MTGSRSQPYTGSGFGFGRAKTITSAPQLETEREQQGYAGAVVETVAAAVSEREGQTMRM